MASIAQLITDIQNAKSTGSGKVEWKGNSLQSILSNDITPLIQTRGVAQVADTTALQALSGSESRAAGIDGVGFFFWAATGTPNNTTIFAASGGGVWKKQSVVQSMALANLTDVQLSGTPTNGQVLTYQSGKWVNSASSASIASLTDVDSSALYSGSVFYKSNIDGKFKTSPFFQITLENPSLVNVEITGALTVTAAVVLQNNLTVGGNLTLTGALSLGSSLAVNGTLNTTGNFSVATNKFTVAASSGNTYIKGTLGVDGKITIGGDGSGGLDVLTGNVFIQNGLSVDDTLFANNGLQVSGGINLDGTLEMTGDLSINTNKFKVLAASGNTTVAGTLDAAGDFKIATNKFTVAAATGNTVVGGTLGVSGNFAVATNKFVVDAATGNTVIAGNFGLASAGKSIIVGVTGGNQVTISDTGIALPISAFTTIGTITSGTSVAAALKWEVVSTASGQVFDTTRYWKIYINSVAYRVALVTGS